LQHTKTTPNLLNTKVQSVLTKEKVYYLSNSVRIYFFLEGTSCEPGSSVSIVSGYGLDDKEIEVRSPAEAKDFSSSLCVQTGSGAHPASCTKGTRGPFTGVRR
jgi:hypothetical protein